MTIKFLTKLIVNSLLYRKSSIFLAVFAIAISTLVLLSIEHIRQSAKNSFNGTISGIDLIVGPRTSDLNLLLTTVFRLGAPSQNMSWDSYQKLKSNSNIEWVLPIALGDSHRGFRVLGTNTLFFEHFHYGKKRDLEFKTGRPLKDLFDVVLGAHVAKKLNYGLDKSIVLSHGVAEISFQNHDAYPFNVVGILKPTGTPIDNALYVSLSGLEAIHSEPINGKVRTPKSITAAFVGLKSRLATFKVQRAINDSKHEALSAILPGVALTQLWQITKGLENTLQLISSLVLFASLLGLGAVLLATARERKPELTILQTLGLGPISMFFLVQAEAIGIALVGIGIAATGFSLILFFASDWIMSHYGIDIAITSFSIQNFLLFAYVILGAILVACIPAFGSFGKLD